MLTAFNDAVPRLTISASAKSAGAPSWSCLTAANYSRARQGVDHALKAGVTIYVVNMGPDGSARDITAWNSENLPKSGGRYIEHPAARLCGPRGCPELGRQYGRLPSDKSRPVSNGERSS